MDKKTLDVNNFFKEASAIKEQRGTNYDNAGRSAYEIALSMFDKKYQPVVAIWPVVQKTSRLVTLAQQASEGNFDKRAWDDTSKDLANYDAMQWQKMVKENKAFGIGQTSIEEQASPEADEDEEMKKVIEEWQKRELENKNH